MSKVTIVISAAVVLTGCASTSGWRAVRIDATSPSSFEESVTLMQQELPSTRRELLGMALEDIWVTGIAEAGDAGVYSDETFLAQLDGLGYKEVIELADATGPSTLRRYTAAIRQRANDARWGGPSQSASANPQGGFTEGPRTYPADSNPFREYSHMAPTWAQPHAQP